MIIDNTCLRVPIRPLVIGRMNHLFSDKISGVKASTKLYSLIETAWANGLEDIEALVPTVLAIDLDQAA